ncbi:hypothetical protein BH20ACT17_BH20ACT17_18860 [soil metagenome]
MTNPIKKTLAAIAALAALGLGGAAIVQASGEEDEKPATGVQADKAKSAALRITNGGSANSVERDSENGATWEVEVTKPGGATVDVRLDEQFGLVVVERDRESSDDGD